MKYMGTFFPTWRMLSFKTVFVLYYLCQISHSCDHEGTNKFYNEAMINYTYVDPVTKELHFPSDTDKLIGGRYGLCSVVTGQEGILIHVIRNDSDNDGCEPAENKNIPNRKKWIALIQRGDCNFETKLRNHNNASAVIVYNNKGGGTKDDLFIMKHPYIKSAITVSITKSAGERLADIVDRGIKVTVTILMGENKSFKPIRSSPKENSSVFYVSLSFIVLMIISLAWLIFYYIQRFRYAHAKQRLSQRLANAAKKVLSKIPIRTLKRGDKETDSDWDQCAVCIENYKVHEVVRVLPCKHLFHKSCVDPWLLDHRSCPICKMDILQAYGLKVQGATRENIDRYDIDAPSSTSIGLDPLDLITHSNDGVIEIVHIHPPTSLAIRAQVSSLRNNSGGMSSSSSSENNASETVVASAAIHHVNKSSQVRTGSLESVNSTASNSSEHLSLVRDNRNKPTDAIPTPV